LGKITIKRFSCGEIYINVDETVRGKDVFLVQTATENVNEDYMELFLLIDTMRRSFANSVHVIIPHFGYARQDKLHEARETISAKLMADLIIKSGADHIVTFHLHSDQIQAFFDVPLDNLNTRKMFAKYFKNKNLNDLVVVSPDVGGAKAAKKFANELDVPIAILSKSRPEHNKATIDHVIGEVAHKTCILYDDMIDTAGSVCRAQSALVKKGANPDIYLCATHPVFSGDAIENLSTASFKEVVTTNTIPVPTEKKFKGLKQISIASLIAEVIDHVIRKTSVSSLYF